MSKLLSKLPFKTRGYISLAGSFLIHLILGTFYLWSDLNSYITSNLHLHGQTYKKATVNQIFPFMILSINIGSLLGVKLATKIGFRLFSCIVSLLLGASVFISSYFLTNFTIFTLFYGFAFGIATGLLYMLPFNIAYVYFSKQKGIVSGIISAGFGFGTTIFIQVVYLLVNPNNLKA
jgi:OFA family oxalate/formate antiporter-like MFS transporter